MKCLPLLFGRGFALCVVLLLPAVSVLGKPSLAARTGLAANPTSVSFGNVVVGSSQSQYETLTNRAAGSITIYKSSVSGTGFSASGLALPLTLSPGQSVTFTLSFAPLASGTTSGTFSITTKYWRANVSIRLSGTGTSAAQLGVSPGSLSFGNVTVGTASSLSSALTATGGSITVSSVTTTNAEFYLNGLSLPLTLTAGQSVPFTVTFAPQSSGTASGTFSFMSSSATAASEALTGSGVAPASHSVTLGWSDGSSGVAGYNIYRGGTSGGPYARVNSSLNPGTSYVDSSVSPGLTYYYVTTAVDSSGVESSYSNQVQAVIPSP